MWPVSGVPQGLAGVGVPQAHRLIGAGAGQPVPVGAERHRPHPVGVAGHGVPQGLAGVGVPQPHRGVGAGGGQPVPVGAERHASTPQSVCPVRGVPRGWPVSASHSRTVVSALALASRCPSGLNATDVTKPVWPVSGCRGVGRCRRSTAAPCVVAGGGQPVPVGAERHRGHRVGVSGQWWPRGWPVSASHSRTV